MHSLGLVTLEIEEAGLHRKVGGLLAQFNGAFDPAQRLAHVNLLIHAVLGRVTHQLPIAWSFPHGLAHPRGDDFIHIHFHEKAHAKLLPVEVHVGGGAAGGVDFVGEPFSVGGCFRLHIRSEDIFARVVFPRTLLACTPVEDDGPVVRVGNREERVGSDGDLLAVHPHRIAEADGGGLVGARPPDLPVGDEATEDLPSPHGGPVVEHLHCGGADGLGHAGRWTELGEDRRSLREKGGSHDKG